MRAYLIGITTKQHFKISAIATLKYVVFSHQFYFLLSLFKLNISYAAALSAISSVYLISAIIPMLSLFDAIIKGTIAVYIFSYFKIDSVVILSITTLMWLLNFAIPAIIGSYFVLLFKPNSNL